MPVVAIIDGVKIMFFFDDHAPPHFHVEFAEYKAQIRLDTLDVLDRAVARTKNGNGPQVGIDPAGSPFLPHGAAQPLAATQGKFRDPLWFQARTRDSDS